jgi:hypothetical protein
VPHISEAPSELSSPPTKIIERKGQGSHSVGGRFTREGRHWAIVEIEAAGFRVEPRRIVTETEPVATDDVDGTPRWRGP